MTLPALPSPLHLLAVRARLGRDSVADRTGGHQNGRAAPAGSPRVEDTGSVSAEPDGTVSRLARGARASATKLRAGLWGAAGGCGAPISTGCGGGVAVRAWCLPRCLDRPGTLRAGAPHAAAASHVCGTRARLHRGRGGRGPASTALARVVRGTRTRAGRRYRGPAARHAPSDRGRPVVRPAPLFTGAPPAPLGAVLADADASWCDAESSP